MAFNADARLAECAPPTYTHGGRTYRGRLLSWDQWAGLAAEWRAVEPVLGTPEGPAAFRRFVRRLCGLAFPRPWWHALVGRPSVAACVLALPFGLAVEAVSDFCVCLSGTPASGLTTTPEPTTPPPPPAASPISSSAPGSAGATAGTPTATPPIPRPTA